MTKINPLNKRNEWIMESIVFYAGGLRNAWRLTRSRVVSCLSSITATTENSTSVVKGLRYTSPAATKITIGPRGLVGEV